MKFVVDDEDNDDVVFDVGADADDDADNADNADNADADSDADVALLSFLLFYLFSSLSTTVVILSCSVSGVVRSQGR